MLILCLYYACTEFTNTTYHHYPLLSITILYVYGTCRNYYISMTCWQIPSDSKLGRFLAEAVHHVGLGTLASTLPWRGATLRQGAPRGHWAGWKRRHGTTSDPTSYATYAYLCILLQHVSRFFKILQVSSRSCPIFGLEDMDVFFHIAACYLLYIMLHHLDCWQYWFRSMSNHFDPCCVCCSGLRVESEGRKGTGPSPSRARDTRGTRWYSWHRPSVGFWQLGRIPKFLDRAAARNALKAMA